jgi:hypothetical protein
MGEIEALPGYRAENPVDLSNYRRLIGYYDFDDEVACCVRRDSGTLCRERHLHGFVAELTDESVTIIGNHCAHQRFDADSQLSVDRRLLENRKAQVRRLGRLAELLEQGSAIETSLAGISAELRVTDAAIDSLRADLGTAAVWRLSDMARRGRSAVTVTAITVRRYVDDRGEPQSERQSVEHRIGTVSGLELFRGDPARELLEQIREITAALKEARALAEAKRPPRGLVIDRLVAMLGDSDRPQRELVKLRAAHTDFLSNDYGVLCYMVNERVDRYRMAHLALQQKSLPDTRDKAKAFIATMDRQHKMVFGADDLRF